MQHRPTDTDTPALKWHPNLWQGQPVNDGFHDSVEHRGTPRNGLRGRAGKGRISVACVKKKGGRMSEMWRSPEWQTQTWSQLWQRPNPPNPLSLCWKTLMRIWSAQQGGGPGAAGPPCHCLLPRSLSSYLLIGQAWLVMKEPWQHGRPSHTDPTPARLHRKPDSTVWSKEPWWHQQSVQRQNQLKMFVQDRPGQKPHHLSLSPL